MQSHRFFIACRRMSSNTVEKVSGFIVIKAGLMGHSTVGFHRVNHVSTEVTFFQSVAIQKGFAFETQTKKKTLVDETRH